MVEIEKGKPFPVDPSRITTHGPTPETSSVNPSREKPNSASVQDEGKDGPRPDLLSRTTKRKALDLKNALTNRERGPVLTGVRDTVTGEMFFKLNGKEVPRTIHTLLRERLESYNSSIAEGKIKLDSRWGQPGTHSDFLALNEALLRRESLGLPITDLQEFEMFNVSLWSNRVGTVVPRCGHCQALTTGVTLLSGR
jgi:hypothetical protein